MEHFRRWLEENNFVRKQLNAAGFFLNSGDEGRMNYNAREVLNNIKIKNAKGAERKLIEYDKLLTLLYKKAKDHQAKIDSSLKTNI